jgi:TRAP-type C4-dicarboxylate transport system permease small subunit
MVEIGRRIRPVLDFVYTLGGFAAAGFLLMLLAVIVLQMLARWTGHTFPGATNYAGYCMAAASFLAMAYALNHGAHIRVTLLLTKLGRWRRLGEFWCFGVGTAAAGYFAVYAIKATYWSRKLHDISQGQDATPIWIPQMAMAIGVTILAIALADHFVRMMFGGSPDIGEDTVEDHHPE